MIHAFVHRFDAGEARRPVLLALHGTGGDEHDLVPVARMIDPDASVLSPRGRVLENGMPRFFRRLAEGVFDQEDLRQRTRELDEFLTAAATHYGFDRSRVVAVGYSNGANIAASLLLASRGAGEPEGGGTGESGTLSVFGGEDAKTVSVPVFIGAILLRPMVPFEPESPPNLHGCKVLISASRQDQIVPPSLTQRLGELLADAGAEVTTRWYPTGHALSQREIEDAAVWYRERFA